MELGSYSKGQKSLEMIIGLVILLVVAGVVIQTFLGVFEQNPSDKYKNTLEKQEVERTCQQLCSDYKEKEGTQAITAAIEYCTRRFNFDNDGDGAVSEKAGVGYSTYSEDGLHCFNIVQCQSGYETLTAEKCRQIMCDYYSNPKYVEDASLASAGERVFRAFEPGVADGKFTGAGTCNIQDVSDPTGEIKTWWSSNFEGNVTAATNPGPAEFRTVCTGVPTEDTQTSSEDDSSSSPPSPPS